MTPRREEVSVDPEQGKIWVPGQGNLPLIGPEGKKLDDAKRQHEKANLHMRRQMLSEYRCLQCKKIIKGKHVKVKWELQEGLGVELLVCNDPHCQGPVILHKDALDVMNPPAERRARLKDTVIPWSDMAGCTENAFRKFLEFEYSRSGGMQAEVEIGRQVGCPYCRESVVLRRNWRWEVTR